MSTLLNSLTTELRRGTLKLAVLSQLRTPQYGYSLVESRPRKYYVLSKYGLEVFLYLKKEWIDNSKELYRLLKEEEENEPN